MFSYLIYGVVYGFAAAMQPGPFQSYLVAQTLRNGWQRAFPIVLAPLLSDGPIICLVVLVLSRVPPWWLQVLRFAGGAFILYLATGALQAWRDYNDRPADGPISQQGIFRATLVNLLNPAPYLYWSLVAGPILLSGWHETPIRGLIFLAGFYVTLVVSLIGILLLCACAGKLGSKINRALLGLSGLALAGFGLYQIRSGISMLLNR
jgi:threonine/homoserine/homoserine lactone efflux protein